MPSETLKTERRFIRIEDWNGNIYYPETGGTSTGGGIVDSGEAVNDGNGVTTTDGNSTSDSQANNGTSIIISSDPNKDMNVITTKFDSISFGKVAGNIRLKSSIGSGNTELLSIRCYYWDNTNQSGSYNGTLLSTTPVTGAIIGATNKYVDIGFVTDFKGTSTSSVSLKVEVLLKKGTNCTIHLDQIAISKAFVGITGTATNYSS